MFRRLAVTGIVAITALVAPTFAAAKVAPCPVVPDAKGDFADPSLDITQVTYAKVGKALSGTIKVAKLAENVATAWGDRFMLTFTANDREVEVYYKRSRTRNEEANVFYQQGLRVDGVFVSDAGIKAEHNLDASTVTITIALPALKSGVGKSVDGAEISDLGARAQGSFIGINNPADSAESDLTFKVAPCVAKK